MIKKLILTSAALLMVSGTWAETVTDVKNKITYSYNSSSDVTVNNAGTETTESYDVTAAAGDYKVTVTGEATTIDGKVLTVFVTPQSLDGGTIVCLESITKSNNSNASFLSVNIDNDATKICDDDDEDTYTIIHGTLYDNYLLACAKAAENDSRIKSGSETATKFTSAEEVDEYNINPDLYYIWTGGKNAARATGCTPVLSVSAKIYTGTTYINSETTYIPTSLPAGFLTPAVTSLTIPSTVTSIADGAFANVSASLTTITANGNYKMWSNYFLMDGAETTVYYVLPGANDQEYTLPATVATIKANALKNTTGVVLNSTNTSLSVGANQSDAVINKPAATLTATVSGKGYVVASQVITTANISTLSTEAKNSCFIDCSSCSTMGTIDLAGLSLGTNCVLYLPAGTTVKNCPDNVVIGNTCDNFVLTDRKEFSIPTKFNATTITYNRTINSSAYGTIVLPFVPDNLTNDMKFAYLDAFDGTNIDFKWTTTFNANEPYIVRNDGVSSFTCFTGAGQVSATGAGVASKGTARFVGVYENIDFDPANANNVYIVSGGEIMKAGNNNGIDAFRCYIKIDGSTAYAPGVRFFDDNNEIDFEHNLETRIENLYESLSNDVIFDLNGNKVTDMNKNQMYIVNGKKIINK